MNISTTKKVCQLLRSGMMKTEVARRLNIHVSSVKRVVKKGRIKRVLLFADTHCGSDVGLTPPSWQWSYIPNPPSEEVRIRNKFAKTQVECWNWYTKTLDILRPIDVCLINGDMIDGDGKRSGGTEQITTDRKKQAAMAIECIKQIKAKRHTMTFGTGYHTGDAEDFELDIAKHFGCKIGSHEWENVNGCVFDLKHKQSNTVNPSTSLFNEIRDNKDWAAVGEQPKADVLVRSHTHRFCVHETEDVIGISTPGLQAYGTKFGSRQCSRKVQFGLVALDVWPDGEVVVHKHIARLGVHKAHTN